MTTLRTSFCYLLPVSYLLLACCLAALIAYPVEKLFDPEMGFPRMINRIALGLLIAGIYPASRLLRLSASEMGFANRISSILLQFAIGFAVGLLILGLVVGVLIELQVRTVLPALLAIPGKLSHEIIAGTRSGILVAIAEETLFRGLLFGALLKYGSVRSAVLITAVLYSGLHFMGGHADPEYAPHSWYSGLLLVPAAFAEPFKLQHLDSLIALFTVSTFLTAVLLERRTGLGYCIGLHASWVAVLRVSRAFTEHAPAPYWGFLVGDYNGIIGILSAIWLGSLTLAGVKLCKTGVLRL